MEAKKSNIASYLRKFALLIPTEPEEVELFEKSNEQFSGNIPDLDNPSNVLNRGRQELQLTPGSQVGIPDSDLENLAMAAREGRKITEEVRKRMKRDRKDAEDD